MIEKMNKSTEKEVSNREHFIKQFRLNPIFESELIWNFALFMNRQSLSRLLILHELYKKILPIPGIIMEFGVYWGRDLALFQNFRGLYEPYNYTRRIIGFDTFEGFIGMHEKDGNHADCRDFNVAKNYEQYLESILKYHETENPLSHIKKFELVKGDVSKTLPKYLESNPETIISFAYFDLDLYEPTLKCLELIKPYLVKGAILAFDELNFPPFPGETIAYKESFGLNKFKLKRFSIEPLITYLEYG